MCYDGILPTIWLHPTPFFSGIEFTGSNGGAGSLVPSAAPSPDPLGAEAKNGVTEAKNGAGEAKNGGASHDAPFRCHCHRFVAVNSSSSSSTPGIAAITNSPLATTTTTTTTTVCRCEATPAGGGGSGGEGGGVRGSRSSLRDMLERLNTLATSNEADDEVDDGHPFPRLDDGIVVAASGHHGNAQ